MGKVTQFNHIIVSQATNRQTGWQRKGENWYRKKNVGYDEAKTIVKENQRRRWLQQHPDYNNRDSYYQLSREDQVIMVRLRTGHSRLRHRMFTKFRIGESAVCHCGTSPMTVEHRI